MKDLSTHLAESNHFEPKLAASEKKKKTLSVRKLLEMERTTKEEDVEGNRMKFDCEKCGEKYESQLVWDHLRSCCKDENNPNNFIGKTRTVSSEILRPSSRYGFETSSILGSLERMVETSFTSYSTCLSSPPISEKTLLQRLGMGSDSPSTPSLGEDQTGSLIALHKLCNTDQVKGDEGSSKQDKSAEDAITREKHEGEDDEEENISADCSAEHRRCATKRKQEEALRSANKKRKKGNSGKRHNSNNNSDNNKTDVSSDEAPSPSPLRTTRNGDTPESKFFKYSALAKELSSGGR